MAAINNTSEQKYISYLRVSTKEQGNSGLGLEAQKRDVNQYVKNCSDCLVAEYIEVESGTKNERVELQKAIDHAKRIGAKLVIANLSRLSRNASFIFKLKDTGVDFVCADNPQANSLTIGIFAVLVQHEREQISERTKKALHSLKLQGVKLGNPNGFTKEAQDKATATKRENAATNVNTNRAKKHLVRMSRLYLLDNQKFTLTAAANELNEQGILTARGKEWTKQNIRRLYKELFG